MKKIYFDNKYQKEIHSKSFEEEFSVVKRLASGGTAVVWVVRTDDGHLRAVKVFNEGIALDTVRSEWETLDWLERNAPENMDLVKIYDAYTGLYRGSERIIVVMEYIYGQDMYDFASDIIESSTYISYDEWRQYAISLFEILSYLHENGVTHRDIKPENEPPARHEIPPGPQSG